jgi:hypothetical protein
MFYAPNTKMLFGDAKTTCDGNVSRPSLPFPSTALNMEAHPANRLTPALKSGLDTKYKAEMMV